MSKHSFPDSSSKCPVKPPKLLKCLLMITDVYDVPFGPMVAQPNSPYKRLNLPLKLKMRCGSNCIIQDQFPGRLKNDSFLHCSCNVKN